MPSVGIVDRLMATQHLCVCIAFEALERLSTPFGEPVQYYITIMSKPNIVIEGSIILPPIGHTS